MDKDISEGEKLDALEEQLSISTFSNFNDPPDLQAYVDKYATALTRDDEKWIIYHIIEFRPIWNELKRNSVRINYIATYFWSILVRLMLIFVNDETSLEELRKANIFNALKFANFAAKPEDITPLISKGLGLLQYYDKGVNIIDFIEGRIKHILGYAKQQVSREEGAIAQDHRDYTTLHGFLKESLAVIKDLSSESIKLAIEKLGPVDNASEKSRAIFEILASFKEYIASIKDALGEFDKSYKVMADQLEIQIQGKEFSYLLNEVESQVKTVVHERKVYKDANAELEKAYERVLSMYALLLDGVKDGVKESYVDTLVDQAFGNASNLVQLSNFLLQASDDKIEEALKKLAEYLKMLNINNSQANEYLGAYISALRSIPEIDTQFFNYYEADIDFPDKCLKVNNALSKLVDRYKQLEKDLASVTREKQELIEALNLVGTVNIPATFMADSVKSGVQRVVEYNEGLARENKGLQEKMHEVETAIPPKYHDNTSLANAIRALTAELSEKDNLIEDLKSKLEVSQKIVDGQVEQLKERDKAKSLVEKQAELSLAALQKALDEKNEENKQLKSDIDKQNGTIAENARVYAEELKQMRGNLSRMEQSLNQTRAELTQSNALTPQLHAQIEMLRAQNNDLQANLESSAAHVEELNNTIAAYDREKAAKAEEMAKRRAERSAKIKADVRQRDEQSEESMQEEPEMPVNNDVPIPSKKIRGKESLLIVILRGYMDLLAQRVSEDIIRGECPFENWGLLIKEKLFEFLESDKKLKDYFQSHDDTRRIDKEMKFFEINDGRLWNLLKCYLGKAWRDIVMDEEVKPQGITLDALKEVKQMYALIDGYGEFEYPIEIYHFYFIVYVIISYFRSALKLNGLLRAINMHKYGDKYEEEVTQPTYLYSEVLDVNRVLSLYHVPGPYLQEVAINTENIPRYYVVNDNDIENWDFLYRTAISNLDETLLEDQDITKITAAGVITNINKGNYVPRLKSAIIKPFIGSGVAQNISIFPVKSFYRNPYLNNLLDRTFVVMNMHTNNYRVVKINPEGVYFVSYPGNALQNPLMPYHLYFSPRDRQNLYLLDYNEPIPPYLIRLDDKYRNKGYIDNDELLISLFPKTENKNISLRELLERVMPTIGVTQGTAGAGLVTSRDILSRFITPID